jgi:chromosomal replication initiation ATPase DnaA
MEQKILPLNSEVTSRAEDFIITPANEEIANLVETWPEKWGVKPYPRAIWLYGPAKSGKTSLAKIWMERAEILWIDKNNLNDSPWRDLSPDIAGVVIDKPEDMIYENENLVLDCFNSLIEKNKYLLFVSGNQPHRLEISLKDLASRLNSLQSFKIEIPDEETLKIIFTKFFSDFSLKVPPEVINYLATRVERDYQKALDIVKLLDQISLEEKRNITIPLIKEKLKL